MRSLCGLWVFELSGLRPSFVIDQPLNLNVRRHKTFRPCHQLMRFNMLSVRILVLAAIVALSSGCSTTQEVTLAKASYTKNLVSVAQVAEEGNSAQMDGNLAAALAKEGLSLRTRLPAGTTRSKDVDALVSYIDVWRWDLVMFMKSLTVRLNDAETGDLLAIGKWSESAFHQFRGESGVQAVMEKVVADVMTRLRVSSKGAQ